MNQSLIEAIVKHPAVSSVYSNGCKIELCTENVALQALCRLRRMRRESKRRIQAAVNAANHFRGHSATRPSMPAPETTHQLLYKAYYAPDRLPATLVSLLERALDMGNGSEPNPAKCK